MKRSVSRQAVHEYALLNPIFSNKPRVLAEATIAFRLAPSSSRSEKLPGVLTAKRPGTEPKVVRSDALDRIDISQTFQKLTDIIPFALSVKDPPSSYDSIQDRLSLSQEGCFALLVAFHFLEREIASASAGVLPTILRQESIPKKARKEDIAAAFLSLHLASEGLDCLFADLSISAKGLKLLEDSGHTTAGPIIYNAVLELQMRLMKTLY